MRPTLLMLAKSAIAARPQAEMTDLSEAVAARLPDHDVTHAYTEQGTPSLRARLTELTAAGVPEVVILPVLLPMEPGFPAWIRRAVHRWQARNPGRMPRVRLAPGPMAEGVTLAALLAACAAAAPEEDITETPTAVPDASAIPTQGRRVLLCMGGPCNDAAAGPLWQYLRAEQDRLKLREADPGMMSCRTSCLGPCNLAPVVQVWPEGTTYCGVDEAALDRILTEHVIGGQPVADLAYPPSRTKQRLRRLSGNTD